ncbi:MAG: flagellar basal body-associated FliL family protein, partial [Deltaproteobacteria bacterium]|nr:flagellar basal body-associated FliL family protein [Deltaproteobacteria bacterium]
MAEEEKEKQQEEQETKKSKGSIVKWIIVAVAVVVLGAGGFAGWYYYTSGSDKEGGGQDEEVVQTPGIWSLGSIVVNLMDDNGERYLKTTIQIEVSSQECVEELVLLKPKVVDSILVLLSSKNYKEIAGFEGKQGLRDEIAVRLNRYLAKGEVRR